MAGFAVLENTLKEEIDESFRIFVLSGFRDLSPNRPAFCRPTRLSLSAFASGFGLN